jgi:hypothetical protein
VSYAEYYTHYNKDFVTDCDKGGRNYVCDFDATTLRLRAKIEPGSYQVPSSPYCRYFRYTSGLIFSKQTFLYGRFEIRCKVPNQGRILCLRSGSGKAPRLLATIGKLTFSSSTINGTPTKPI